MGPGKYDPRYHQDGKNNPLVIPAAYGPANVKHSSDLVTPKLPALRAYQHSLPAPRVEASSFDTQATQRGKSTFNRAYASCHVGGNGTDSDAGKLHAPGDTDMDGAYAMRTANKMFRTTPLRGLQHHPPYFHDGSARTLGEVVEHYNKQKSLDLTKDQQADLVEYLKTL